MLFHACFNSPEMPPRPFLLANSNSSIPKTFLAFNIDQYALLYHTFFHSASAFRNISMSEEKIYRKISLDSYKNHSCFCKGSPFFTFRSILKQNCKQIVIIQVRYCIFGKTMVEYTMDNEGTSLISQNR